MVSSITSAISSAVLESLKSAGIIPQEPVQTSDPAAAVQGSVAQVVQDLTGEGHTLTSTSITSGPETDHRPDKIHTLISVPLSSRVPDKIQSKIWANEYIDLGTLLSSLPGDPKYNFTVKSSGSNQPVVSLEPVQNSKRITSIDQWTTAFQVFVAVYTIRFPDSAPGLMKYSATVRDLAAKNAHWRYYDENFRYLRQKSLFPWDEVHWELWLQAHHMTKLSSSNIDCEQSLFSSDLVRGVHARGHLRVSGVLLDGPRKKRGETARSLPQTIRLTPLTGNQSSRCARILLEISPK